MIGIRASWHCSLCEARESTFQLARPGEARLPDPPPHWKVVAKTAYCPDHARDGEQIAEAERASGASGLYGRAA